MTISASGGGRQGDTVLLSVSSGYNEDTSNHKLTPPHPCHLPCHPTLCFCLELFSPCHLGCIFLSGDLAWNPLATPGPFCQLIILRVFPGHFYDPGTMAVS